MTDIEASVSVDVDVSETVTQLREIGDAFHEVANTLERRVDPNPCTCGPREACHLCGGGPK